MAKLKTIALTLSGLSAVSGAAAAQNATPNQTGMAMMRLNSALLDQAKAKTFGSGSLWASLKKDFRMSEVNSELVRRHESKFAANGAYFDRTITRSKPYMYHIATEVKKRNMPAESHSSPSLKVHSSPKPNPTSAHPACGSSCRQPAVISAWKNTFV